MGTDPKSWAETFVAELNVGGERVPFERVIARHLDEISKMRSISGLTWRSLASLLIRAGARRVDGGLISADQLRVGHARLVRHAAKAADDLPAKDNPLNARDRRSVKPGPKSVAELPVSPRPRAAVPMASEDVSPKARAASIDREDVSDDEIALALSRLTKLSSKT
jgi:hypothetical protein